MRARKVRLSRSTKLWQSVYFILVGGQFAKDGIVTEVIIIKTNDNDNSKS